MTRLFRNTVFVGILVVFIPACGDGGGNVVAPTDFKKAPPPPTSPAGGKPKVPNMKPA